MRKDELSRISAPLLAWYRQNKRELPWRENTDPYRVWISEVMLQQTRVEAVRERYTRFLQELPDLTALARVSDERLMKLWEGLGYYSRARNMKKAAQFCTERYAGNLPGSYEALLALPGLGKYTAGAVASIAFSIPVPAVDGNVYRVYTRLLADDSDITSSAVQKRIYADISAMIPTDFPGEFNQSLMELGATVCLPNGAPKCLSCPLASFCDAYAGGTPEAFPVKPAKAPRRIEEKTVLLLLCDGETAIQRRPERGLLAGLYEFPMLEGMLTLPELKKYLASSGISAQELEALPSAKHIFSHIEWHMRGYAVTLSEKNGPFLWTDRHGLTEKYAIASAQKKYLAEAEKRLK